MTGKMLDLTTSWEGIVEQNHKAAQSRREDAEINLLKRVIYQNNDGADRADLFRRIVMRRILGIVRAVMYMVVAAVAVIVLVKYFG